MESIFGLMVEYMKGNGNKVRCMEEDSTNGLMEDSMKANMHSIKNKDLEFIHGLMVEGFKAFGKKEKGKVKESTLLPMENAGKVYGIMTKE